MLRVGGNTGALKAESTDCFSLRDSLVSGLNTNNIQTTAQSLIELRNQHPIQIIGKLKPGNPNLYILVKVIEIGAINKNKNPNLYIELLSRLVSHENFQTELTYTCYIGKNVENMTPADYADKLKFSEAAAIFNPKDNCLAKLQAENEALKAELEAKDKVISSLRNALKRDDGANKTTKVGIMGRAIDQSESRFSDFFRKLNKATQTETETKTETKTGSSTLVDRIRSNGLA